MTPEEDSGENHNETTPGRSIISTTSIYAAFLKRISYITASSISPVLHEAKAVLCTVLLPKPARELLYSLDNRSLSGINQAPPKGVSVRNP